MRGKQEAGRGWYDLIEGSPGLAFVTLQFHSWSPLLRSGSCRSGSPSLLLRSFYRLLTRWFTWYLALLTIEEQSTPHVLRPVITADDVMTPCGEELALVVPSRMDRMLNI